MGMTFFVFASTRNVKGALVDVLFNAGKPCTAGPAKEVWSRSRTGGAARAEVAHTQIVAAIARNAMVIGEYDGIVWR